MENRKRELIDLIRMLIREIGFINRHKSKASDFTRERVFSFALVFSLILRKSIKSMQLVLNELFVEAHIKNPVTSSAYSQIRKNFKHTAFIELNENAIASYYKGKIKRWKGYRVLGIDGSKIILPNHREIKETFGSIPIKNQYGESGEYNCALFVCRYDVLNRMAVQGSLSPGASYEVTEAIEFLRDSGPEKNLENDLNVYDRGYASYEFIANLVHYKKEFIIRCSSGSFKEARSLFFEETDWSKVVTLKAPRHVYKRLKEAGLPTEVEVRFVSVQLDTGEIEVLVTSLIKANIQRTEFKELYFLRWGVESFFHTLKGRLNLENFTGKSVESVRQDFWSSIFISNIETIFTEDAEKEINANLKENKLPKKINKAVSFNAIKNMALKLFFYGEGGDVEEKLTQLFQINTIVQREGRSVPRKTYSPKRSSNYQKRSRKHVF